MDQIIENYIVLPGFIGLIIIIGLKIYTFNSYKKIKKKLDPNFNAYKYQGWVGNTFYMNPYMLKEEGETSITLLKIIKRHNIILRLIFIYLISLCCIVVLFAIINQIFF